jgi:hypothetical protein
VTVDPAQHRLAEVPQGAEEEGDALPLVMALELGVGRVEAGAEVGPGAEGTVAGAGQDDDPRRRLVAGPGQRFSGWLRVTVATPDSSVTTTSWRSGGSATQLLDQLRGSPTSGLASGGL